MAANPTLMRAIRARCLDCAGSAGAVKQCRNSSCDLHAFRMGFNPYYGREKPEGYAPPIKAVRAHCLDCCLAQVSEVRACTATRCHLHKLRMGENVFSKPKGIHAARRQKSPTSETFFVWTVCEEELLGIDVLVRKSA